MLPVVFAYTSQEDWDIAFAFVDENGAAINMSGRSYRVKLTDQAGTVVATLTTADSSLAVTGANSNVISGRVDNSVTGLLATGCTYSADLTWFSGSEDHRIVPAIVWHTRPGVVVPNSYSSAVQLYLDEDSLTAGAPVVVALATTNGAAQVALATTQAGLAAASATEAEGYKDDAEAAAASIEGTYEDLRIAQKLAAVGIATIEPLFTSATILADGSFSSTFAGWGMSFDYTRTGDFDVTRIYAGLETKPGLLRGLIANSSGTILMEAHAYVEANGYVTFTWPRITTSADFASNVGYLLWQSESNSSRVWKPDVAPSDYRPNQTTYPEYYTTTSQSEVVVGGSISSGWTAVSGGSIGLANFYAEFHNSRLFVNQSTYIKPVRAAVSNAFTGAVSVVSGMVKPNTFAGRASPFSGWGALYTVSSLPSSINGVRLPNLSRSAAVTSDTDKWATLRFEARDGSTTATLLAYATIELDPDTQSYPDPLDAVWINASTGAVVTDLKALFTGASAFVGYRAYNMAGGPAVCSEVTCASLPAGAGTYYYLASNSGTWNTVTGSVFGVDFTTLTSPSVSTARKLFKRQEPTDLSRRVANLEAGSLGTLAIPPKMYLVESRQWNMYFDGLLPWLPQGLAFDVLTTKGATLNECYRWTPGTSDSGSYAMTVQAYNQATGQAMGAPATSTLVVSDTAAGSGVAKNVLYIGDSKTADGAVVTELVTLIAAGTGLNLSFIGSQGSGSAKHEGRSGWSAGTFVGGSSPFYSGGAVDFSAYATAISASSIDIVIIDLGANDVFSAESDPALLGVGGFIESMLINIETLITKLKLYNANVKIGVALTTPPSKYQDAFGSSYTNDSYSGNAQNLYRYMRNIYRAWLRQIRYFGGRESENIYVLPFNSCVDRVNSYPSSSVAAHSRTATTITRQTDGLHPSSVGKLQVADAAYAFLKSVG